MSSVVSIVDTVRDLGVTIDSRLTTADQVAAVCRLAYSLQLRRLRTITTAGEPMLRKWWHRRSFCAVWTTATRCCTALVMIQSGAFDLCRMQWHAFCRELVAAITSHRPANFDASIT